jgi:hypothetical protein
VVSLNLLPGKARTWAFLYRLSKHLLAGWTGSNMEGAPSLRPEEHCGLPGTS